jgi:ATP-dependent Lon protease
LISRRAGRINVYSRILPPHSLKTMDIEYDNRTDDAQGKSGLVRASDVLPSVIHLIPQNRRPFFPGQVIPLLVDTQSWAETIKQVHDSPHRMLGLLLARNEDHAGHFDPKNFYAMDTACRVHRVQRHEGHLQVLLEGLQRFRIQEWISSKPPMAAR